MPKKVIKAKNVVSFSTGEVKEQVTAAPDVVDEELEAAAAEAEAAVAKAEAAAEKAETAVRDTAEEVSELAPERPAPEPEAIETRPLNLRTSRYLDDDPQDPDWADEDDFENDYEEDGEDGVSTFAEIFIPLHDDSTGAVIRKGMVIVSVIVILCCLVAIVMKNGAVSGTIAPDFPALADRTAAAARAVLSTL